MKKRKREKKRIMWLKYGDSLCSSLNRRAVKSGAECQSVQKIWRWALLRQGWAVVSLTCQKMDF